MFKRSFGGRLRAHTVIAFAAMILLAVGNGQTVSASGKDWSFYGVFEILGKMFSPAVGAFGNKDLNNGAATRLAAPGTCDTAGPIEVESSGGTTAPTAYATLKAAFDAINAGTHTGDIDIDVCGDTTETATASLSASGTGSASYTEFTIAPAGGAARTIGGTAAAGSALVELNGADNVLIDGLNTGGNSLTISNTLVSSTSGTSTIRFVNDATNNTITRASILGSATMVGGTNGGNVWFSTAATGGTGNDNNTISNSNIGPAGTNLPSKLIYSSGTTTSAATGNSGIVINNNNLYDFFLPTGIFRATDIGGGSTDWTISNNRVYQTAPRTFTSTTTTTSAGIYIANTSTTSTGNNFQVTGNTVGFSNAAGNGTFTIIGGNIRFRPIHLQVNTSTAPITASVISNNTVAGINLTTVPTANSTGTSGSFIGIFPQTGLIEMTNNTIGSQTATGSITIAANSTFTSENYGIFNFSSANALISGNNIGGMTVSNSSTGAGILFGIKCDLTASVACTIQNNLVGGTVANSMQNNATSTSTRMVGIETASGGNSVTNNTVRNFTMSAGNTGTGTTSSIIGIAQTSGASSATVSQNVSQNRVHSLSNTNATAAVSVIGINQSGGTTAASTNIVARNFVYSLALSTSGAGVLRGINVSAGVTRYQNNMVRLGVNANGPYDIAGINEISGTNNFYHNSVFIGGSSGTSNLLTFAFASTVTLNTRNIQNNIFANDRTFSGGTGGNFAAQFGGTLPSPAGLNSNYNVYQSNDTNTLIRAGGTAYNLAGWRAASGNQDANSLQVTLAQINFVNPTGDAGSVDLHVQSPTVIEGAGISIPAVTDDFDGQVRADFTPIDIGADAGNFTPVDLSAPALSFVGFGTTTLTTNRTLTVTISDATGVAGGMFSPRIYFRKNGGAYFSTQCVMTGGTSQNGTYECTIDYSLVGGVMAGDTIDYFVIAQDTLGNVGSAPGGAVAADVNTVTTPPAIPSTFNIVAPFPTAVTVGGGGDYTSLTNTGGLFAALNAGVITGNVTIEIVSDLTGETGSVGLNQLQEEGAGAGTYTVTIKPSGSARTITSTTTATSLIRLIGADRVTIDGSLSAGTDRSLTLINANTATSGTTVVGIFSLGVGAGATNNTVKNTVIQNGTMFEASTTSFNFGIYAGGSGSANGPDNDNLTIQNNLIQRSQYGMQIIGSTAGSVDNLVIAGNTIGGTEAADYIGRFGMLIGEATGSTITRNTIRNVVYSAAANPVGIAVSTNFVNSSITRNNITNVRYTGTGGFGGKGLDINTANANSNLTVANNFISEVRGDGWNNLAGDSIVGMRISGTTGGVNVYYNSVNLGSGSFAGNTSGTLSAAFYVAATATSLNVRNNIFATNLDNTAVTTDKSYAFYSAAPATAYTAINFNDYFVPASSATGPQVLGFLGADLLTLADLQMATGQDANSKSVDPMFVSATDLHLQAMSPMRGMATPIAPIQNDIDGDTRHPATPDMGADEFQSFAAPTVQLSSATYSGAEGTSATITVTRTGDTTISSTVNYATSDGTATGGASCGTGFDYVSTSGTLSFAASETSKTFMVQICSDVVVKGDETVNITLSGPTGATLGTPAAAVLTITNVTPMFGQLQFSSATYNANEISGTATVTVTRTGGSEGAVTVNYATTNGTATGGASCMTGIDFVSTSGTLNFTGGETSKTFDVMICDDAIFEGNETVNLALSSVTGGATIGMQNTAVLTIIDNEMAQPGTLALSSATYTFNEGVGVAVFTVNRTGGSNGTVSVSFSTSNGTATGGPSCANSPDFTALSGTVSFNEGETSKTFGIPICDDSIVEGDETFNVTLSSPTGGAMLGSPSTAVATITDNDVANQPLQFSSVSYTGREGNSVAVTVTRTGGTAGTAGVSYATANGTATGGAACTAGVDYITASGMLFFTMGEASKTFNVQLCSDSTVKPGETINLTLSNPTGLGTLGSPSTAVITIIDQARVLNDFDGDGKSDHAVFRPSNNVWYILESSTSTLRSEAFGTGNDRLVPADYDGDGKTDVAVYRPSTGTWFILLSGSGSLRSETWGTGGDIPVPADYDGDGKADLAVWRESNGTWYLRRSTNGVAMTQPFGQSGDRPLVGDFDGDGKADLTVIRADAPPTSPVSVYRLNSSDNSFTATQWGVRADIFVIEDYDGDGKDDLAVYRDGIWYVQKSSDNSLLVENWGTAADIPIAGDFDGDGRADFTVWRESTGTYYTKGTGGSNIFQPWGTSGDIPLNNNVSF